MIIHIISCGMCIINMTYMYIFMLYMYILHVTFVCNYVTYVHIWHKGLSGKVLDSRSRGCGFRDSLEALHCVLKQDTLSTA